MNDLQKSWIYYVSLFFVITVCCLAILGGVNKINSENHRINTFYIMCSPYGNGTSCSCNTFGDNVELAKLCLNTTSWNYDLRVK